MDRRLLLDIPDLPPQAFQHVGDKRIKPEGGGGKGGGSNTTTVQQSIPKELVPYIEEVIQQGQKVAALPYVPYGGQRIASFTPEQRDVQGQVMGMMTPEEYQAAMMGAARTGDLAYDLAQTGLSQGVAGAGAAGQLGMNVARSGLGQGMSDIYQAGQLGRNLAQTGLGQGLSGIGAAGQLGMNVAQTGLSRGLEGATQAGLLGMQTAQTGLGRGIEGATQAGQLGLNLAQRGMQRGLGFTPGTFGQREAAYYMSPYQQAVTDVALREAQRAADIERRNIGLQAAGRGTIGGSAEALQRAELARNLMERRGDIQAQGSEAAFLAAQQQYERDRAAAAQAAGLGTQVGGTGLSNAVQSALGLAQTGGSSLGNYLQAALGLGGMGQAGLGTGLQAGSTLAQLGEAGLGRYLQSGTALGELGQAGLGTGLQAALGLGGMGQAGLGTSLQSALGLGELAGAEQRAELARLEAQRQVAAEIQAQNQRVLTQRYEDFLAQRGYPREQLAFYSDIVRGNAPLFGTVQQTTQPMPGITQQLLGAGLGALGAYRAFA